MSSFGYDNANDIYFIKTTDPEYLKILLAEDPMPEEIVFELPENFVRQMCKQLALVTQNKLNELPEENLT